MKIQANGKVIVYDLDGVEREKEPVDARECIDRLGWTETPAEPKIENDSEGSTENDSEGSAASSPSETRRTRNTATE